MQGREESVELNTEKALIAEGKDSKIFCDAFLEHLGLEQSVQVVDAGSVTELSIFVRTLRSVSGFDRLHSLGIVRDAERDARSAFDSVCDALTRAGIPAPREPGQFTAETRPRVAVFILPDCLSPGMLEDLCLRSVKIAPALGCVDRLFDCVRERALPTPANQAKARAQAFLATQLHYCAHVGLAAQMGIWRWQDEALQPLRRFLKAL